MSCAVTSTHLCTTQRLSEVDSIYCFDLVELSVQVPRSTLLRWAMWVHFSLGTTRCWCGYYTPIAWAWGWSFCQGKHHATVSPPARPWFCEVDNFSIHSPGLVCSCLPCSSCSWYFFPESQCSCDTHRHLYFPGSLCLHALVAFLVLCVKCRLWFLTLSFSSLFLSPYFSGSSSRAISDIDIMWMWCWMHLFSSLIQSSDTEFIARCLTSAEKQNSIFN